ncbi:hypothetical protein FACS1894200_12500 [Spirochaetia bacterium]|nr:hypothetical protein FACS1894200_12500 [Spirochaetia bacterium]
MSTVYDEITLTNAGDVADCERGYIKESEVRQVTMRVCADTGADTLIINEATRAVLGLLIEGPAEVWLADGQRPGCDVTEPVEVHWKDRRMTCEPWLIANAPEVLLGAIPLEEMDITVDCKGQRLIGAHGEKQLRRVR